MRSSHRPAKPVHRNDHRTSASPPVQRNPLGDDRFAALLAQASSFFDQAERDMDAEKAAAIEEIKALMQEYGLSLEDIEG